MGLQLATSIGAGCLFIWWYNRDPGYSPRGALLGGFLVGLAVNYCMMFAITWVRFGWKAARSMRMLG